MNKEKANKINTLLVRFGFMVMGISRDFVKGDTKVESLKEEIKKYTLMELVEASNHPELDESKSKVDDRLVSAIYTVLNFSVCEKNSIDPILTIPVGNKAHHLIFVSSDKS